MSTAGVEDARRDTARAPASDQTIPPNAAAASLPASGGANVQPALPRDDGAPSSSFTPTPPTALAQQPNTAPHHGGHLAANANGLENTQIDDRGSTNVRNGTTGKPQNERSTLDVPSQSAAQRSQPSPSSTALTGATVSDSAESIGRGSRGSIAAKRRKGSTASSQRTTSARRQAAEEAGPPHPGKGEEGLPTMERKNKSAIARFFSKLNCCGASKSADSMDTEDPLVTSKTTNIPSTRNRQPTPATTNQGIKVPNQHSTESHELVDEKSSKLRDSERTDDSSIAQISPDAPRQDIISEKPLAGTIPESSVPESNDHTGSDQSVKERPPPSLPGTSERIEDEDPGRTEAAQTSDVKVIVNAPSPEIPQQSQPTTFVEPPAHEYNDVEMPDAPTSTVQEIPKEASQEAIPPRQIDLPPPPPAIDRLPLSQPTPSSRESSLLATPPTEKQQWLLPPIQPHFKGKKCLVLDLDETLVHSSFKILHQADFTIPVEIEGQYHNVYVIKRPGVDQFMKRVGELYEVVVFTASVSKYGDPLLDQLDIHQVVHHRLFRESCYNHQGNYVKDLSQVGRDLRETIIIDNSPTSYIFHPQHAVPISSWFSDAHDNELLDLIPVLEDLAGSQVKDVSLVLDVAL
ncbi:MAG: hypothetical protein M1837_000702 [Sclerophora amabilis]|nr:MAG: hypothetical protein M1837_000702 [Sclerophora amabilis]